MKIFLYQIMFTILKNINFICGPEIFFTEDMFNMVADDFALNPINSVKIENYLTLSEPRDRSCFSLKRC